VLAGSKKRDEPQARLVLANHTVTIRIHIPDDALPNRPRQATVEQRCVTIASAAPPTVAAAAAVHHGGRVVHCKGRESAAVENARHKAEVFGGR